MKTVTSLIKKEVSRTISCRAAVPKEDWARAWFMWLGIATRQVVDAFVPGAKVEFRETPEAYHITVRVRERSG